MDEKQKENIQRTQQEMKEYVLKIAQLTLQVQKMSEQQKQENAEKIQQLQRRIESFPQAVRAEYDAQLKLLSENGKVKEASVPKDTTAYQQSADRKESASVEKESEHLLQNSKSSANQETQWTPSSQTQPIIPKKKKKVGCFFFIVIFVFLVSTVAVFTVWAMNDITGNRGRMIETKTITVEKGSYLKQISEKLEENKVISSAFLFRLYAKLTKQDAALQYGTFDLATNLSYDDLLKELKTEHKRDTVRVTFPEGIPAVQFAKRMEEAGLASADEFLEVANTGDFSQFRFWSLRDEKPNQFMKAEGYLFPDTYEFYRDDSVYNMVAKIYAEFDKRFTQEMYDRIKNMGFTLSEFMTLASIVQEEAGPAQHQKDVAAVFMNRLAPNSPVKLLQSNCSSYIRNDNDNNYIHNTIAPYYGGWDKIPPEVIVAYDTYQTPGLPAGPISNPGMDAILNTLNYAESAYYGDYYFFVTDLAGKYYYGKTDAEHEQNKAAANKVNASLK